MSQSRYLYYYQNCVLDTLILSKHIKSQMELPRLRGAVCTASSSEGTSTVLAKGGLEIVLGQKASTTRAKKSIAQFNLREKNVVSCRVTLRGKGFYNFLDLFVNFIVPKIYIDNLIKTDTLNKSQILEDKSNDKSNYKSNDKRLAKSINIGIKNFLEFPQIEPFFSEFESLKGFNINIMITPKKIASFSKGET